MSENLKDFDDRLAELSNWQIEQQKKLRAFQEAQKRLLDLEHQNVLSSLRTQNFEQRKEKITEKQSNNSSENHDPGDLNLQKLLNIESKDLFQLNCSALKLNEPKVSLFNKASHPVQKNYDALCQESNVEIEEKDFNQPRKFLKRGEGLARFRMTLDDFKGPPKIYKDKRIKTYLNGKPNEGSKNSKNVKQVKKCTRNVKSAQSLVQNKPVPVKIYVPENKSIKGNCAKNSEQKVKKSIQRPQNIPKSALENLALKSCNVATEWYNLMKEKEKLESKTEDLGLKSLPGTENCLETSFVDVENKKDEKELKIFEILEKKVDENSFCSTSSFVDKLMEQSLSSTPSKSVSNNSTKPYAQGLKSLCSQFLGEQHMDKLENLCNVDSDETPDEKSEDEIESVKENGIILNNIPLENEKDKYEIVQIPSEEEVEEKQPEPSHKVNKTLLQEYIRDFKKFKSALAENAHKFEKPEENPPEDPPKKEVQVNHRDIALKLQRKGLQDNVKQLLNWECPQRKRPIKRAIKKIKPRPIKSDKSKAVDKDQSEKIIFNSALLKTRLEELEKEIEIFRKENKNLEKLQKECNEERIRLSRERKEFEKQMQEEKEKFELHMAEEHKKLQKERTVFERYCKQVKNQPTRQEREEIVNLKKEVEKLTETLATKEARWGASQARLRNQVKNLEKENSQLKAENEKFKKSSIKKVSFENERNLSTKIIHVINAELQKLKPTVVKNSVSKCTKNQPLSARVERHLEEKPIRRIKSVPNMKKHEDIDLCTEVANDYDERALGSVSTDSGIETNGSRYVRQSRISDASAGKEDSKIKDSVVGVQNISQSSPTFDHLLECHNGRRFVESTSNDCVESAVREAIFENNEVESTNPKILEIKNRLERLKLYNNSEENPKSIMGKMVRLPKETSINYRNSESEEANESSAEEDEENDIEIVEYSGRNSKFKMLAYEPNLYKNKKSF